MVTIITSIATTLVTGTSRGRLSWLSSHSGKVRFMAGGEGGDDDFVERQGKGEHAAGQQRRAEVRQDDVAEGLPAIGAEVHGRFDQAV